MIYNFDFAYIADEVIVKNLYIAEHHRNKGVGTFILKYHLEKWKKENITKIYFNADIKMTDFLIKMGFKIDKQISNKYLFIYPLKA